MVLMAALLVVMGWLAACQSEGGAAADRRKVVGDTATVSAAGESVATATLLSLIHISEPTRPY